LTERSSAAGVLMASSNAKQQAIIPGDPQAQLKFEVLAGVHRGATLSIDKVADYRIGSSPRADIVLRDAGIAPEHAVLRIESAAVRIDATGGEVSIEQKSLPLGHGCRVRLPVEFTLGEARLRLSRPGSDPALRDARQLLAQAKRSLADKPIAIASVAICLAVVATAVAVGRPRAVQMNGAAAKTGEIDAQGAGTNSKAAATTQQAIEELGARLRAAKIHTLQVNAVDGRLVVSGKLIKQQVLEWAAIRQWFDQTYGRGIVLSANVTADDGPAMPTLQLQAIWYGDRPYIITAHGERYYQGAVLDNGWIVRQISEHHLMLAKDGKTAVLNY
jgi:hypothetical protein